MKLKKWLAGILAVAMAVGTLGLFAGCGGKNNDDPTPKPDDDNPVVTPGGDDDEGIQYYLVGSGLGELATNNWDQTTTDENLKFARTGNTAVITADLYEGDEFAIVHNFDWAGQMGINVVANGGKDAEDNVVFETGGGYDVKNIKVAEGQSGKYKLTLTINDESSVAGFASNVLTWECLEQYEVVFASWYDTDDTTLIKKTVVLKDSKTEALDYKAESKTPIPRFYEFKNWVTKDAEGTETPADFTQNIGESVNFYARVGEAENTAHKEDPSTWVIKKDGEPIATFAQDDKNYKQHNVLVTSYEFEENDTFTVTDGTVENVKMTCPYATVFPLKENVYTVKQAGNYQFTLITEVGEDDTVTVKEFIYTELVPTFTGYAIIGNFANASWSFVNGVNPVLVETGVGTKIYKGTLVVTEDMLTLGSEGGVAQTTPNFPFKVCSITKNVVVWDGCFGDGGNSTKPAGSSEPGVNDNYWITTAGTYTVTVDMNANGGSGKMTVISAATEYIFVGKWLASQGDGGNWGYDGSNPKLTETEPGSGVFEGTITTDIANAQVKVCSFLGEFSWDTPNWGALKDGSQLSGGNVVLEEAGTWKFTLTIATNTLTWEKVEA